MGEHVGGDLNEERLEVTLVPGAEDAGDLRRGRAGAHPEQVKGLRDQLHVGVLDAVVHHLDEVPGPVRANVHAARGAVDLRRDRFEHRAERAVRLGRAARHDARPVQGAFLAAGHSGSDEVQPARAQLPLAAAGIGVVRVAAVDDDVALVQQRDKFPDDRVGGLARLDHDDDRAGPFQGRDEVLGGLTRDERALVPVLGDEAAGALGRAVVQRDTVPVPGQVAGQVAAHDRQPGDTNLRGFLVLAH